MRGEQGGPDVVRDVERRIWLSSLAANFTGALIAVLFAAAGSVMYPGGITRGRFLAQLAIGALGSYGVAVVTSRRLIVRRLFAPAVGWLLEDRPPTAEERNALAQQPRRQATGFLVYWLAFDIVVYPYAHYLIRYRPEPVAFYKAFIFITLSIFFAWTLAYLFVERAIRPLMSRALAGERTVPKTMAILPRLLLAWTVAAAFPLAAIVIEVAGLNAQQLPQSVRVIYLITGTSFVIGIVATWLGARAFTAPLARLRHAIGRVAAGHLVDVAVDEAGEIGELQAGFNEMVSELKERDHVRELLGRHVGGEVAAIAADVERGTRGEHKDVSTVFVDVIGSSQLTLMKTPDEVVSLLNAFFEVVVRAIDSEGGVINKFEGDGVLGVFGAPAAQPDHAERALRAARTVREGIEALAETMWIDAAVGVASGRAIAGNVGAAERFEYTVIGRPVDHAIRLCDEAKRVPSRVLACRTTLEEAPTEAEHWDVAQEIATDGEPVLAGQPSSCS
jgi:adenylate cyclase